MEVIGTKVTFHEELMRRSLDKFRWAWHSFWITWAITSGLNWALVLLSCTAWVVIAVAHYVWLLSAERKEARRCSPSA